MRTRGPARAALGIILSSLLLVATAPNLLRLVVAVDGLVLLALGVSVLKQLLAPQAGDDQRDLLNRQKPKDRRPPDLVRLERLLGSTTYPPDEFDVRIRPVLERIVVGKLRRRVRAGGKTDAELPPELRALLAHSSERPREDVDVAYLLRLVDLIEAM